MTLIAAAPLAHPVVLLLLAGALIFGGQLVSTVTGFGSNILALPLLALLVGLEPAKAAIVVLSTLIYLVLVAKWWRRVDRRELLFICVVGGVGLVAGMLLFHVLPQRAS